MSKLERYISEHASCPIPQDKAMNFLCAIKKASVPTPVPVPSQDLADAQRQGLLAGARDSIKQTVVDKTKAYRERKKRIMEGLGAGTGLALASRAPAGYLGRPANMLIGLAAGKMGGSALHSLGSGASETFRKTSALNNGSLLAEDNSVGALAEMDKGMEASEYATVPPKPVEDPNLLTPNEVNVGGQAFTPEELERLRAEETLYQQRVEEAMRQKDEADHYRTLLSQADMNLQQLQGQVAQEQQIRAQAEQTAMDASAQATSANQELQRLRTAVMAALNPPVPPQMEMMGQEQAPPQGEMVGQGQAPPQVGAQEQALPQKTADWKGRLIGGAVGAALGGGIQRVSDLPQAHLGGQSWKENALARRVEALEKKENKGFFGKYDLAFTRALHDIAKANREHPVLSTVAATTVGAISGATLGSRIMDRFKPHAVAAEALGPEAIKARQEEAKKALENMMNSLKNKG